jgi:hypothetical protein
MKLELTGNLTTILTGHRNIKAYLHRFYISGEQTCPCGKEDQTTEHIIYKLRQTEGREGQTEGGGKQDG